MSRAGWAIDIDRDDITQAQLVADPETPLAAGQVRVHIDSYAMTANNITSHALGFGGDFSAATRAQLDPIAYNGATGVDMTGIRVGSVGALADMLLNLSASSVSGNKPSFKQDTAMPATVCTCNTQCASARALWMAASTFSRLRMMPGSASRRSRSRGP